MDGQIFRFGPFEMHREQRRLYRDGKLLQLGSRAFDILQILVMRAGEVVRHEELIAMVWPDTFVAENNLRVNMTALRRALGPEGSLTNGLIANVPGRGYSFTAPVAHQTVEHAPDRHDNSEGLRTLPRPLGAVFGRDTALATLAGQVPSRRLVTITGAGGIGKTTLVLAASHHLRNAYPDGVILVDLAPISDPQLVASAVATALGQAFRNESVVSELTAVIADRRILIILDSCEHVVDPAALLSEQLLQSTSRLGIIATSREALRAEGEWVLPLSPLELPEDDANVSAKSALSFSAIQLFVNRASAVGGSFVFDDANAPYIANICRQLDGIPLALELAASRVQTLGPKVLAASLNDRFHVLTRGRRTAVPRHQTLRATLDWSYRLLTASEQHVLCRLSTLVGRFTSKAATTVAADSAISDFEIEEALANLVAKSLISVDASYDHTIFRLADTTRAYAVEKLAESGELRRVQRAHARFFLEAFGEAEGDFENLPAIDWLRLYGWQIDDLRAALDWAFAPGGDDALGVELTAIAIPLWHQLSLLDECLGRVAQALSAHSKESRDKRRMQLQAALGWPQMVAVSDFPSGADAWKETLALAETLGDIDYQLRSLWALWVDRTNSAQPREAMVFADRFRKLTESSRGRSDDAVADRMQGATFHLLGQQPQAQALLEKMLASYDEQSHRRHIIRFQYDQRLLAELALSRVLWLRGESEESLFLVEKLIDRAKVLNHGPTYANILAEAACPIALMANDFSLAQRFIALLRTETRARSMDVWRTYADAFEGELLIRRGEPKLGLAMMYPALTKLRATGFVLYDMAFRGVVAAGLMAVGDNVEAATELDLAVAQCAKTGEAWCLPELQRIRAELHAAVKEQQAAKNLLRSASALASAQGSEFWLARIEASPAW
ncbi:ATP-binding protein [Mesorhizobium japonicum]|uniref:Transcriptional regulator n=1 Tax=Mesorhizobium japonicum (strain LMG 29417 / CECT 9101 / MAFF 303099) TaxID=266835 RepID=Q987X1_RHILO|nr:winged helix-turn-helix domain-containing protein [Mesorhizobium japonicum]BAB53079.1 transcriptional regulator [Mesorhizobium japonicum MAFF 303099]